MKIKTRGLDDASLLGWRDRFERIAVVAALAVTHLDEHEILAVAHHQIDLAALGVLITGNQRQTLCREPAGSSLLDLLPELAPTSGRCLVGWLRSISWR